MTLMTILLTIWGVLTTILIVLLIYRSTLTMHEDDQLFLDEAEHHMQTEQIELLHRMNEAQHHRGGVHGKTATTAAAASKLQKRARKDGPTAAAEQASGPRERGQTSCRAHRSEAPREAPNLREGFLLLRVAAAFGKHQGSEEDAQGIATRPQEGSR